MKMKMNGHGKSCNLLSFMLFCFSLINGRDFLDYRLRHDHSFFLRLRQNQSNKCDDKDGVYDSCLDCPFVVGFNGKFRDT